MEMKTYLICFLAFIYLPSLTFAAEDITDCQYANGKWTLKREKMKLKTTNECEDMCWQTEKGNKLHCIFWQLDNNGLCHLHLVGSYKSWNHYKYGDDFSTYGINYCSSTFILDTTYGTIVTTENAPFCEKYSGTGKLVSVMYNGIETENDCKKNCRQGCLVWEYNIRKQCKLTNLIEEKDHGGSYGISFCQDIEKPNFQCKCGIPNTSLKESNRIQGGSDAKKDKYPWQVYIQAHTPENEQFQPCGGTLISDSSILTADHCLWVREIRVEKENIKVWIYVYDIILESWRHEKVKDIIIFHDIDNPNNKQDIAILTIEPIDFKKFRRMKPICLPEGIDDFSGFTYENQETQVLGWGLLRPNGPMSAWLQELFVYSMSNEKCQRYLKTEYDLNKGQMCSKGRNGRTPLQGDSGGPYMIINKLTGQYLQTGIISKRRNNQQGISVAARTSSNLKWIKDNWQWNGPECT